MKFNRAVVATASVAHALAWAAFLWLALWPYSYQGVSATAVQVDELGNRIGTTESEVVRYSSSIIEANGIWVALPLLIPVVLTGLALVTLLNWKGRSGIRALILGGLAAALLAFGVLSSLSFGVFYLRPRWR